MSIEPMAIVTAYIRPNMEQRVVDALHALPDFHIAICIGVVCPPDSAEQICDDIAKAAWTGDKGNRVIFIAPLLGLPYIRELGRKERRVQ